MEPSTKHIARIYLKKTTIKYSRTGNSIRSQAQQYLVNTTSNIALSFNFHIQYFNSTQNRIHWYSTSCSYHHIKCEMTLSLTHLSPPNVHWTFCKITYTVSTTAIRSVFVYNKIHLSSLRLEMFRQPYKIVDFTKYIASIRHINSLCCTLGYDCLKWNSGRHMWTVHQLTDKLMTYYYYREYICSLNYKNILIYSQEVENTST